MSVNFLISLEIFQFGLQIPHAPCIKQVSERKIGIGFFLYFYVLKKHLRERGVFIYFVLFMYIKQLLNSFLELKLSDLKV